jgi:histidine triad (HIT) family protein
MVFCANNKYNIITFFRMRIKMDCLFCKIVHSEIPATIVFEDATIMAFKDIRPVAPTHLLIIPKEHIASIADLQEQQASLAGHMIVSASKLTKTLGFSEQGYRLVFNVNPQGGQEVYHIHLHLLGGRQMTWPPG